MLRRLALLSHVVRDARGVDFGAFSGPELSSLGVGRGHIWKPDPDQFAEARRCLDLIGRRWEDALSRLKSFVKE